MCTQVNCCHGTAHARYVHNSMIQTIYLCHDVINLIRNIVHIFIMLSLLALQIAAYSGGFMVAI